MKKQITLFFVLCIGLLTHAQQKKYSFSLDEAIQFALDSSYTALNSRKEVAKALKRKWETTADGLPQIDGKIEYLNNLKLRTSVIPANAFDRTAPADVFIPVQFGIEQQASVGATISQLIFNGSYLVGLEAASVFVNYTQTQKEKQDLSIVEGVTNAYGSVLLTQENIDVVQSNINTIEKNLNETQQIFKNGLTEEESVEQLQITLLQLKNQINNLNRLSVIAKQMFHLALGIPINSTTALTDTLESLAAQKELNTDNSKRFSIANNNEFKLSELLVEQRRLELKLEKSRTLPSVGAFFDFGTQAFDNEFSFFDGDKRWFSYYTVGGQINVPIFSSFKSGARIKQSKLAYEQAQVSHNENTQRIQLAYDQAKSDFDFAVENLVTLKQNLELAERIEKKNQIKFTEGIASSFELRQAQTQLYSAQQQYLNAQLTLIQNSAKLQTIINIAK